MLQEMGGAISFMTSCFYSCTNRALPEEKHMHVSLFNTPLMSFIFYIFILFCFSDCFLNSMTCQQWEAVSEENKMI